MRFTQVVISSPGVPLTGVRAQVRTVEWRSSGAAAPADLSKILAIDDQGIESSGVPGARVSVAAWRADYRPAADVAPADVTGVSIRLVNTGTMELSGYVHWRLDHCTSQKKCTAYAEAGRADRVTIPAGGSAVVTTDDPHDRRPSPGLALDVPGGGRHAALPPGSAFDVARPRTGIPTVGIAREAAVMRRQREGSFVAGPSR